MPIAVSSSATPAKTPASSAGERRATRLSAMRTSMDRRSLTGSSGSISVTTLRRVAREEIGRHGRARDDEEVAVGAVTDTDNRPRPALRRR